MRTPALVRKGDPGLGRCYPCRSPGDEVGCFGPLLLRELASSPAGRACKRCRLGGSGTRRSAAALAAMAKAACTSAWPGRSRFLEGLVPLDPPWSVVPMTLHLRDLGAGRFARLACFFRGRPLILRIWASRSRRSEPIGREFVRTWVGGLAVSWSDSGARTGPHEIGLIANIAAKGDDDAARRLYRKYRMELFRFGVHVLHDQGLAEEMVQETFIKFCRQARNYDTSRGPVRGWLFTMARSAAYDIARRPSSRPLLPVEDFQLPPQYDTVDEALTVLTVDQALDKLPSIYADVMRLVRDGFTHSQIAGRLGIPIGTVKSRTAKAADTLRAELASLRGGDDAF